MILNDCHLTDVRLAQRYGRHWKKIKEQTGLNDCHLTDVRLAQRYGRHWKKIKEQTGIREVRGVVFCRAALRDRKESQSTNAYPTENASECHSLPATSEEQRLSPTLP